MTELSSTAQAGVAAAFTEEAVAAVDETVILLHPPLPLVGDSIWKERRCQQNDSLVNGQAVATTELLSAALRDRALAAIAGDHSPCNTHVECRSNCWPESPRIVITS